MAFTAAFRRDAKNEGKAHCLDVEVTGGVGRFWAARARISDLGVRDICVGCQFPTVMWRYGFHLS